MDVYNLITKIPYVIMLGIGLVIILQLFIGGLNDLSIHIEDVEDEEVYAAIGAEHMLTADYGSSESNYSRRVELPVEIVENEEPDEDEAGFQTEGEDCYIEESPIIDGSEYGFGIIGLSQEFDESVENNCEVQDSLFETPVVLKSDEDAFEALLVIYDA